jgi:hypothetical protein
MIGVAIFGICGFVAIGIPGLLAWAVVADVRSGRGYGLGILTSVLLAITIIVVVSFTILAQVQPKPTGRTPTAS